MCGTCGTWNRSVRISLRCQRPSMMLHRCVRLQDAETSSGLWHCGPSCARSELRRRGFVRYGVGTTYDCARVRLGRNGREGLRPQAPCKMHCAIHGVWCDAGMLRRQRHGRRGRARVRQGLQSWDVLEICLFAAQADISGSCARHFCG